MEGQHNVEVGGSMGGGRVDMVGRVGRWVVGDRCMVGMVGGQGMVDRALVAWVDEEGMGEWLDGSTDC